MKTGLNSLSWKPLSSCVHPDRAFGSLNLHCIQFSQNPKQTSGQVIQMLAQRLFLMKMCELLLGSCSPAGVVGICTSGCIVSTRIHVRTALQPKVGIYVPFLDILKSKEHLFNSIITVTKVKSFLFFPRPL